MAQAWIAKGYSVSVLCRILGIPRSTYYYQTSYRVEHKKVSEGRPVPGYSFTKSGQKISDEQIKEWLLEEIENDGFAYGYRKLTIILRRHYSLIINKKKSYRLCSELGILRPQRQPKPAAKRKRAKNRTITGSNPLWETDVKYGFIHGEDRFFFILSYIDVYDRTIIAYHIGLDVQLQTQAAPLNRPCKSVRSWSSMTLSSAAIMDHNINR